MPSNLHNKQAATQPGIVVMVWWPLIEFLYGSHYFTRLTFGGTKDLTTKQMETGTNLKEIKELLFAETNFIKEFGYDRIVEHEDSFHYTLSYLSLKNEKAVEFEIDLREPACFALITQLEHSKLPEGYYMNNGKRVRIHIEKYLEDKKIGLRRKTSTGYCNFICIEREITNAKQ